LGQDSRDSSGGQREPHALFVPAVGRQVDSEEWTDTGLNVGEKEIQPVEAAQGTSFASDAIPAM
jgi:hypothetical protein